MKGQTNWYSCLNFLPNGYLASCLFDKTIKISNTKTGNEIRKLKGHKAHVECLNVLPNGYLASGVGKGEIKICDTNTENKIRTLKGHTEFIHCLVVLPNGYLVSSSGDKTIKIWDTNKLPVYCLFIDFNNERIFPKKTHFIVHKSLLLPITILS